jgi:two-component system chemotaxis response regulator CheB
LTKQGVQTYSTVVIGGSAGGREALIELLAQLPEDFPAAIAVVLHLHPHSDAADMAITLQKHCRLPLQEAAEKECLQPGQVYLAPANYHLLLETDGRFALTIDEKVSYSRPAIDVLFETAAEAYQKKLVGVLLSGASSDGAEGMVRIKALGGFTLVQDPATASASMMPGAAINRGGIDRILPPAEIGRYLLQLVGGND